MRLGAKAAVEELDGDDLARERIVSLPHLAVSPLAEAAAELIAIRDPLSDGHRRDGKGRPRARSTMGDAGAALGAVEDELGLIRRARVLGRRNRDARGAVLLIRTTGDEARVLP